MSELVATDQEREMSAVPLLAVVTGANWWLQSQVTGTVTQLVSTNTSTVGTHLLQPLTAIFRIN